MPPNGFIEGSECLFGLIERVAKTRLFGFVLSGGKERRHLTDEPSQHSAHRSKILQPHPFRSGAESVVLLFLLAGRKSPQKQARIGGHRVALSAVGLLVLLVPQVHIPAAQRLFAVRFEQAVRMLAVGARQRRHDPARRPGGDLTGLDPLQQFIGQIGQQSKPAADPADVASCLLRHLALRTAELIDQFTNHTGLFDRLPVTRLRSCQSQQQCLRHLAFPYLHHTGVFAQLLQSFDAPVTIDQCQPLRFLSNRHHRRQLPAAADRGGQQIGCLAVAYPQLSETKLQAMQITGLGSNGKHHGAYSISTLQPFP